MAGTGSVSIAVGTTVPGDFPAEIRDVALQRALSLLSSYDRRLLNAHLATDDIVLDEVTVDLPARLINPTTDDLATALADGIARALSQHLAALPLPAKEFLPERLRGIAMRVAEASRETKWHEKALQWLLPRDKPLEVGPAERVEAKRVEGELHGVLDEQLASARSGVQITLPKVEQLYDAFLVYGKEHGLNVKSRVGTAPALLEDKAAFTDFTRVDSDKNPDGNLAKKLWWKFVNKSLENNPRHEVVHAMHMTQVRVTVMRQVRAKYQAPSVHKLSNEGLAEIQQRINSFETGANYPMFERLACRTGGPGGRRSLDESEYKASLKQGVTEVSNALQQPDQRLKVAFSVDDPAETNQLKKVWHWLRDFKSSSTGALGVLGSSQTQMMSNMFGPVGVAAALIYLHTLALPAAAALPIVYWILLNHGVRAKVREKGQLLLEKGRGDGGGA